MDEFRSLVGCAFCMTTLTAHEIDQFGTARTWGKDDLVNLPICPTCALQHQHLPASARDRPDRFACDDCGLVVNCLAALTNFRVQIGHLEGVLQLCANCALEGPATYWTRELEPHVITRSDERG